MPYFSNVPFCWGQVRTFNLVVLGQGLHTCSSIEEEYTDYERLVRLIDKYHKNDYYYRFADNRSFYVCVSLYPPHSSGRVLWFHIGRPWVSASIFCFQIITWVNINGFSPNLLCALILWRSGLGLLMGNFRQFLWVICPKHAHIFVSGW